MKNDSLLETIAVYEKLGAAYADQVAHVRLPQLQEFIALLPKAARVLDVGCAAGRDSAILRDAGCKVLGIDLAYGFLELAKRRVPRARFQHIDLRELAMRDAFDGIWAHAVLLNLERREIPDVLGRFWAALKPGGTCYLGVKEGSGERFIGEPLVQDMKRRETYFERSELEILLKGANFEIKKLAVYDDPLGRSATKWLCAFAEK